MRYVNANPRAPSPLPDGLGLRRHHEDAAEKSLLDSKPKTGGRNNYGRKTSRHRGRSQAAVPHHRLQAQQGRHSGARRGHEYDPNRLSDRVAALPRR